MDKESADSCAFNLQQLSRELWTIHQGITLIGVHANAIEWGKPSGANVFALIDPLVEARGNEVFKRTMDSIDSYYQALLSEECIWQTGGGLTHGPYGAINKDNIEREIERARTDSEAMIEGGDLAERLMMTDRPFGPTYNHLKHWISKGAGWEALDGENLGNKMIPVIFEPLDVIAWYSALQE